MEHINRFDEIVNAAVQGSQPEPYEVEIESDGDQPEDIDATCTCPYDCGDYCKHMITVLLELAEGGVEREAVERVLSDAHPRKLREFLLDESERDADLRWRLLTRLKEQDTQSLIDDVLAGCVQIRLDRGERVPTADGHDHRRIDLLVDEESLGEASAEIVRRDLLEVLVASLASSPLCSAANHRTNPGLLQIDEGVFRCDVMFVLVSLEVSLDVVGQVGIARLPAVAAGVLVGLDAQAVLPAVAGVDIRRLDLRDLEGPQPDERPQLDDEAVPL